jgi:hypothetical protein
MPMKTRECILCGARPTTASHLFTKTIREEFPNDDGSVFLMHEPLDPATSVKTTSFTGSGQTHSQPKVLCLTCNGAWMSQIEEAAGTSIAALIRSESVLMPTSLQRSLATWALAVAILRAEIVPGSFRFDHATAVAFRERGIEAVTARVWFINIENSVVIRGRAAGLASTYMPATDGEVAVFWLRNLCILVAAREVSAKVDRAILGIRKATISIWPPTENAVWPLPNSVTESDLLRVLGAEDDLPASFFVQGKRRRGKLTETILRVNGNLPADDLHHEMLAHRVAKAMGPHNIDGEMSLLIREAEGLP